MELTVEKCYRQKVTVSTCVQLASLHQNHQLKSLKTSIHFQWAVSYACFLMFIAQNLITFLLILQIEGKLVSISMSSYIFIPVLWSRRITLKWNWKKGGQIGKFHYNCELSWTNAIDIILWIAMWNHFWINLSFEPSGLVGCRCRILGCPIF